MMYQLFITTSLCITYGLLYLIFPIFFTNKTVQTSSRSIFSLGIIFLFSILGYAVAVTITDPELGNRILHGFGGGFMALLVCFLVVKDTNIQIRKFQFFLFSLLVVATLGVANEILEFFLQNYTDLVLAQSINDTWYDLISNSVGSFIAAVLFLPFIDNKR